MVMVMRGHYFYEDKGCGQCLAGSATNIGTCRHILCCLLGLLILAAVSGGCASKGEPMPVECPVDWLTLPPNSKPNKLPPELQPADTKVQRSTFREKTNEYSYFMICFDCPDGGHAVRRHYINWLKRLKYHEDPDPAMIEAFRGGLPNAPGRPTLMVSKNKLIGVCVQRIENYSADEEHASGEYLLTLMEFKKPESSRPLNREMQL